MLDRERDVVDAATPPLTFGSALAVNRRHGVLLDARQPLPPLRPRVLKHQTADGIRDSLPPPTTCPVNPALRFFHERRGGPR